MNFGFTKIQWNVVPFANSPGKIKNTGLGLKCKAEAGSEVSVFGFVFGNITLPPNR
jgi:hypothetical protein